MPANYLNHQAHWPGQHPVDDSDTEHPGHQPGQHALPQSVQHTVQHTVQHPVQHAVHHSIPAMQYHHPQHHQHHQHHHQIEPTTLGWANSIHATSMAPHQTLPVPTHHQMTLLSPYGQSHSMRPDSGHNLSPHLGNPGAMAHPMSLPPVDAITMATSHNARYPAIPPPIPHQVVGQQGIRGVLPSASGDRSSPDEPCEPEMDEKDGTWPCKCCGKRYRHAKHLRRHHARHTGDTPYECPLCQRRFGRSDVLKRHYQKCATRRGEPVGDHLAGQRGHPRRQRNNMKHAHGTPPNGHHQGNSPVSDSSMNGHHSHHPSMDSMSGQLSYMNGHMGH